MASYAEKGKEVAIASKGLKRLRRKVASSSSAQKAPPARRFGAKVVEEHGLKWFTAQKEAKYVFSKPEECNLTSMREFYANWNTSYEKSTKVKVQGHVVHFTTRYFNAFLGTLVVDPEMFLMLEKTPYRDIHHTLCREHSSAQWARSENDTHSTLSFSYLTKEARVWVKLVCVVLLPGKHTTEITSEKFPRELVIEEQEANLHLPLTGNLARKMINVTKVKEPTTSSAPFLTPVELHDNVQ
ncbi:hypothetical protein HAX54_052397, partial [Datura stramonium]|nr:hypothetical protein [Datura stramonium]